MSHRVATGWIMDADKALDELMGAARDRLAERRAQAEAGRSSEEARVVAARALADARVMLAADKWAKLDAQKRDDADG